MVSQESRDGVVGRIVTHSVPLQNGQFVTLKVDDIIIPESKIENVEFSLIVEKRDLIGSDQEDWRNQYGETGYGFDSERQNYVPPGQRTSISSTVVFNIVEGPHTQEKDLPLANMWITENACPYVDQCTDAHWMVEFSAKDLGSGMFKIRIRSSDDHHKPFWWHDSFKVGGKGQVKGAAWVSCCSQSVELEIEDVAKNKIVVFTEEDSGTRWEIFSCGDWCCCSDFHLEEIFYS